MTRLYITRHGQTKWNVERRMQGQQNSELTSLGRQQAKWLGESLKDVHLDVILSSSSGRTLNTADIIRGERNIEIIPSDDLREINLGIWEGMLHTEVSAQYPVEYENFWKAPHLYKPYGGESFSDLFCRVAAKMESILSQYEGKNVLVVTHGITLKAILAYFENKEIRDILSGPFMQETCLNIVEVDGTYKKIILQGDVSHYQVTE